VEFTSEEQGGKGGKEGHTSISKDYWHHSEIKGFLLTL
jgi:hypothetical protein